VNDLISEEFAKILKVKYTPLEKQVGTAEKGGSVKIFGNSEPIKIFIEGVPQGVIIQPLIVKDLSHPVNVGRVFLGRNGGKLEFAPTEGYIKINKNEVRIVKKNTPMTGGEVIDSRFQKVFKSPGSYVHLDTGMIYEGTVNQCEDGLTDPVIPTYVQKILDWPLPQTGKELKQFLGFVGYYRGFFPDIAELTFEMNDMKKGGGLKWDANVEQKFEQLKKRFESAPLRCYPDYTSEEPFILDTDFSSTALAAVLSQIQEGKESFVGAGARK
jgi:hypothetical protein